MFVKNAIVKMDWEQEGFFETRRDGWIAAVQLYDTAEKGIVPVTFKDRKAYVLLGENNQPLTRKDIQDTLKDLLSADMLDSPFEDLFPENCVELGQDGIITNSDGLIFWGLDDFEDDIIDRMDDLSGYFEDVIEDM